jgi:heat shock protein HtpX
MYNQIASNKRKSVLLLLLSFVIILALGYVIAEVFGYGPEILILFGLVGFFLNLGSYFAGDKVALAVAGAQPLRKEDSAYVYNMVENLCITTGLPMPNIYVINDDAMNAFATGRKPETASIALTTGIVNGLENQELEGVIAHELAHIKNYDIRFMTLVIMSVGIIALLGDYFLRAQWFSSRRRSRDSNGGGALMIVGIILAILAPLVAQLIKFAVSRRREYLADASAALMTRYPDGLASALEKIGRQSLPLHRANEATAHLYIANPFGKRGGVRKMFATHPPIEDRVKALRGMIGKN